MTTASSPDDAHVASTMRAMVVEAPGGPDVMCWRQMPFPEAGTGEVVVRHRAIGVNFIDAYFRGGRYPWPTTPLIPGAEAAGDIVSLGAGVTGWAVGDRVAYVSQTGAYATERVMAADRLVRVPDGVADDLAAASLLKGLTVQCLVTSSFAAQPGQTVLVHAAAGGVGLLLGQWLREIGTTAIGVVGAQAKVDAALGAGYRHVLVRGDGDLPDQVRALNGGRGCDAVYDSVGADTWRDSLRCLDRFGVFVSFGQSSGAIQGFGIADLAKGSLSAVRPSLFDYIVTPEALARRSAELFARLLDGRLRAGALQHAALAEAVEVHRAMESRSTTGATVLLP